METLTVKQPEDGAVPLEIGVGCECLQAHVHLGTKNFSIGWIRRWPRARFVRVVKLFRILQYLVFAQPVYCCTPAYYLDEFENRIVIHPILAQRPEAMIKELHEGIVRDFSHKLVRLANAA